MAQSKTSLHTCESARQELLRLNVECGWSWPKIAQMAKYRGIPAGTLWSFAKGERGMPELLKSRLRIPKKPRPPEEYSRAADWLAEREQPRNVYKRIIGQKGET